MIRFFPAPAPAERVLRLNPETARRASEEMAPEPSAVPANNPPAEEADPDKERKCGASAGYFAAD